MLLVVLAALLVPVQQASMNCVDTGSKVATTQTQPLHGPAGMTAVLNVSSSDDHSKNSHLCSAEYQLLVVRAAAGAPEVVSLTSTDDDYGRSLSLRLDGFSQDGGQVFGIISEGGKHPYTALFDYNTTERKVQLIDLRERFAHVVAAKCSPTFDVIGTTETGAIVLELGSAKECAAKGRWLLNAASSRVKRLPQGTPIVSLHEFKDRAPEAAH